LVALEIYNTKGQKVKSLVNIHQSPGQHSVIWNGADENNQPVSSGVYFFTMTAGSKKQTKKMIMMK
jgi:flagellar hook assembly protein FlgD